MKWDKAINYLIIIFITINVILGAANYKKNISAYRIDDERIETIVKVLEQDNILIEAELPRNYASIAPIEMLPLEITSDVRNNIVNDVLGKGAIITKQSGVLPYEPAIRIYTKEDKTIKFRTNQIEYMDESIAVEQGRPVEEKEALAIANEFVKEWESLRDYTDLEIEYKIESYGASVTYYEVYNKMPIFTTYKHVKLTQDGVFEAYISGGVVQGTSDEVEPIQPIDKVLFALRESLQTDEPLIIQDITLGYAMLNTDERHILEEKAVPMYKIVIEGLDEPIFVNAYTNEQEI